MGWAHWGKLAIDSFRNWEGEFVFHNAGFDVPFLEWNFNAPDFRSFTQASFTFPKHKVNDTLIMANILDPANTVALKPLSVRYLGTQWDLDEGYLKHVMNSNGWGWGEVPLDCPPYINYGGLDVFRTAFLYDKLKNEIKKFPKTYELEMATLWVLDKMSRNGFAVDTKFAKKSYDKIADQCEQIRNRVKEEFHVAVGSNRDVLNKLQQLTDYEFTVETKKGALSLDREVLKDVIEKTQHPLAKLVFKHRKKLKVMQSYLRRLTGEGITNLVASDGRVHPQINGKVSAWGARTGRLAVSNPPLQQLPRADKNDPDADTVRGCFIASEGNRLVLADLDQAEFRIFSSISGDKGLIDLFRDETTDAFTSIAREVFHDPNLGKKDPRRHITKNFLYSRLYGASDRKMAKVGGVPIEEVHAFFQEFDKTYPGVDRLMNQVIEVGKKRLEEEGIAYIKTIYTGRHIPADPEKVYTLMNFLCQASQAELVKKGLVEMDKSGLGDMITLSIHDETVLDVPEQDVEEISKTVIDCMSDYTTFKLPLTADATSSWAWSLKNTEYANKPGKRP